MRRTEMERDKVFLHLATRIVSAPSMPQINALQPNHLLPLELLIKVISFTAVGSRQYNHNNVSRSSTGYYERLRALAQVCRLWYRVVKDSPELWRFVDLDDTPFEWKAALSRSRDHTLVVLSHRFVARCDPQFWSAVSKHIHRWETADFSFHTNDPMPLEAFTVLENPAPVVRDSNYFLTPTLRGSRSPYVSSPIRPLG